MITDRQVEQTIGALLRGGVILAALVVLIGGVFYLAQNGHRPADHYFFHGEPAELRSPSTTIRAALARQPAAIIQLGLLLLILTPIARVVFSVVAFAVEQDRMYVGITLVVLGVLLYSLLGS